MFRSVAPESHASGEAVPCQSLEHDRFARTLLVQLPETRVSDYTNLKCPEAKPHLGRPSAKVDLTPARPMLYAGSRAA